MSEIVTLPVFFTTTVYVTVSPTSAPVVLDADLVTVSSAFFVTVFTVALAEPDTSLLLGSFPVAEAVFSILPASTSAWVTVYL